MKTEDMVYIERKKEPERRQITQSGHCFDASLWLVLRSEHALLTRAYRFEHVP